MHPRTQELLRYLEIQRATLRDAVDNIPPSLHGERPGVDRWSVAEVLEHLAVVERRITGILRHRFETARADGLRQEEEMAPLAGEMETPKILDRSRPIIASGSALPKGEMDTDAAWSALEESRRELRDLVAATDGFALGDIVFPHPALGPLNMYQWIMFLGGHEARHAAQIHEIGTTLATG